MRIIDIRMDTQKSKKDAGSDPLADLQGRQVVAGAKQLRKALVTGRANLVFLAENADPALTEPIAALCLEHHVKCVWVRHMSELGQACGIDVGTAAAAVVESTQF